MEQCIYTVHHGTIIGSLQQLLLLNRHELFSGHGAKLSKPAIINTRFLRSLQHLYMHNFLGSNSSNCSTTVTVSCNILLAIINSSCDSGTCTLETYNSNFIARQLCAQKVPEVLEDSILASCKLCVKLV